MPCWYCDVLERGMSLSTVFFLEDLGFCDQNEVRREDIQAAQQLADKFVQDYQSLGFTIVRIPSAPIAERADMILKHLGESVVPVQLEQDLSAKTDAD